MHAVPVTPTSRGRTLRTGAFTLSAALLLLAAGCGQPQTLSSAEAATPAYPPATTTAPPIAPKVTPLPVDVQREADRKFVEQLVVHTQLGVDLANIARDRAEHPELVTLAGRMVTSQLADIATMKAWLGTGNPVLQGAPPIDMEGMSTDMQGLDTHMQDKMGTTAGIPPKGTPSGTVNAATVDLEGLKTVTPFDLPFLNAMIPHHEEAVALAKQIALTTKDPAIKTLADHLVRDQGAEVTQMTGWRTKWYPTAPALHGPA